MADVTDKARAIKAENQVEQLERELDLLKSRIKVKTTFSTQFKRNTHPGYQKSEIPVLMENHHQHH